MHRVHAPAARPPAATLSATEAHHVARVLRLVAGDEVVVFDGAGREWLGRLARATGTSVIVDLVEARTSVAEPAVHVTLGIAVLKGDQMDAVVRDATMMGVSAIAPFASAHVALPERAWRARSLERWARVAVASAKQCSRAVVPDLKAAVRFEELATDETFDAKLLCVEPARGGGDPVTTVARPRRALVMVGPEGGWSAAELALARTEAARFIGLGPRTLRAESVPIVVLSALWSVWGWQ